MDNELIMHKRCRQLLGSPQDAEDALGDLRLRLFNLLHREPERLTSIDNVTAWLRRVANNHCLDRLRRTPQTCDLEHIDLDLQNNACWQPLTYNPEYLAYLQEELSALNEALKLLPSQLCEALEQRCINGAEYHELALQLEISEANVRKRVQLARQQLRGKLKPFDSAGAEL